MVGFGKKLGISAIVLNPMTKGLGGGRGTQSKDDLTVRVTARQQETVSRSALTCADEPAGARHNEMDAKGAASKKARLSPMKQEHAQQTEIWLLGSGSVGHALESDAIPAAMRRDGSKW
jgi:hypothetical protein